MNHPAIQQNGLVACEEVRSSSSISCDQKVPVLCPKPRRRGQLTGADPIKPIRAMNFSHQKDLCDSAAGADILEMFLTNDCYGDVDLQWEDSHRMTSSPPFFYGSPPTRSANPLIQDARFLEEKANTPLTPLPFLSSSSSTSPSGARRGGFFRTTTNFGPLPAAVRIEGFDCLERDRCGCGIPAFA